MTDTVDTNVNTGTNPAEGQVSTPVDNAGANVPPSNTGDGNTVTAAQTDVAGSSQDNNVTDGQIDYNALTLPEEFKQDANFLTNFKVVVEKYNLNSSDPKKNLEGFIQYIRDEAVQFNANEETRLQELTKSYEDALKKDPVFGKDYEGNLKFAVDAIEKFGGKELSDLMEKDIILNNPAIVKAFANIGKQINDAKIITGNQTQATPERLRDDEGNAVLDFSKSFPSQN